jgi:hypothetical protein
LSYREVDKQHPRRCRRFHSTDKASRPFLQPRVLEETDDGEHQPYDGNVAAGDECLAERCDHLQRTEAAKQASHEPRHSYYEERVYAEDKPDDDDRNTDESQ